MPSSLYIGRGVVPKSASAAFQITPRDMKPVDVGTIRGGRSGPKTALYAVQPGCDSPTV